MQCSPEHTKHAAKGMSPDQPKHQQKAESSGSSSSTSSSDKQSDSEQDPEGLVKTQILEWFSQDPKGARPLIHIVQEYCEAKPIPYCREKPFSQWPKEMGIGIDSMQACEVKVCPTCSRRVKAEEGVDLTGM